MKDRHQMLDNSELMAPELPEFFTESFAVASGEALASSTRAMRVRQALFPESLSSSMSLLTLSPSLETLAAPARALKEAIEDLVHFQHEVDLVQGLIPQLIKLLNDQDESRVSEACVWLRRLASSSEPALLMLRERPQILHALIKALDGREGVSAEAVEASAHFLRMVTKDEVGRLTLFKTGGIGFLVRLLATDNEVAVKYALTTLNALIRYQEGAKAVVKEEQGLMAIIKLIGGRDEGEIGFLIILLDCVSMLVHGDERGKTTAVSMNVAKEALDIVTSENDDHKLISTAIRLLKVLSTESECRSRLLENNAWSVMFQVMDKCPLSSKLFMDALIILRNLSFQHQLVTMTLLRAKRLVSFLDCDKLNVASVASGVLANVAYTNNETKADLIKAGAVSKLLQLLLNQGASEARIDLLYSSLSCLQNLSALPIEPRSSLLSELNSNSGVDFLLQMAKSPSNNHMLLKVTWATLLNLSGSTRLRKRFTEDKELIESLVQSLDKVIEGQLKRDSLSSVSSMEWSVECAESKSILLQLLIASASDESVRVMRQRGLQQLLRLLQDDKGDVRIFSNKLKTILKEGVKKNRESNSLAQARVFTDEMASPEVEHRPRSVVHHYQNVDQLVSPRSKGAYENIAIKKDDIGHKAREVGGEEVTLIDKTNWEYKDRKSKNRTFVTSDL